MKKKLLVFVLVVFVVHNGFSQLSVAPVLGINSSRFGGDLPEVRFHNQFRAGILLRTGFDAVYSLQTGLQYSGKGTGLYFDENDKDAYALSYLELPLHIVISADLELGSLQFFLGPYLAYAISGEYKYLSDEEDRTRRLDIGTSDDDELKPFDFGLNVGAGYLFNDFQVQAGYGGSMVNISNLEDEVIRNNTIFITLAYFFSPGTSASPRSRTPFSRF